MLRAHAIFVLAPSHSKCFRAPMFSINGVHCSCFPLKEQFSTEASLFYAFYCIFITTVSERTQLNFDIAMMDGELWIRNGNMFMMGPGGSGKTCTLAAVLEEKPPSIRESTPCAKKPVRAVAQCKIGVSNEGDSKTHFVRITDEDYSDMISTSAKCIPLPTQPAPSPQLTSTQESDCNIDTSPEVVLRVVVVLLRSTSQWCLPGVVALKENFSFE